jgi:ceramide glucosyltransferase
MAHRIVKIGEIAATVGAISGIAYNLFSVWSGGRFLRSGRAANRSVRPTQPSVSILKPLKGTDPEMHASFRSHCVQDYAEYELIFGVSDAADPAVAMVEQLKAEFPQRAIQLIICKEQLGANAKVSSLAQMFPEAKYDYLVVSDSDIRVGPQYLARVTAPLDREEVGLVTCLYRGTPAANMFSRLESLGIATDFVPGVLVAKTVEGKIRFGLGSTLAFRREDLVAVGGFESLVDHLADDYQLGKRIAEMGREVVISSEVVETFLPRYDLTGFIQHQLRWARTIRDSRYWGSVGLMFTFALPWALWSVILSRGGLLQWIVLGVAAGSRVLTAWFVGHRVLEDKKCIGSAWLIPLRDVIAISVWAASFVGNVVVWRGERFRLKEGKLVSLENGSPV